MRRIKYYQAINEALAQLLERDERVFLIGQGLDSPWSVGRTIEGLSARFGNKRVIDTPLAEGGFTGIGIGAALVGMRPVIVHPRMDFMFLAMDQIFNNAAKWHYMFGGEVNVPVVIRAIVNRGGGQAAQHSQSLQAMFCHVPGIKVVMPSTAYDAKGLLIAAVEDGNPVVFIDDKWLYDSESEVPEEAYGVPIGKGVIRRIGKDVTVAAVSYMAEQALEAALCLERDGIDVEVIDLRSIKPLDEKLLLESVKKTGRLVTADGGWQSCGVGSEISAIVAEKAFAYLKAPILRVSLPEAPAPASCVLEDAYYPRAKEIVSAVKRLLG